MASTAHISVSAQTSEAILKEVNKARMKIDNERLLKIFFAGSDLNIEHIFFRRKNADEFLVEGTRRIIGHIEV
jgi:hypothetical protein